MTTPATPRIAGKRGRLRSERVALRYVHEYATVALPAPAYPVDVRGGIADTAWQMLGNGPDPTCTVAPEGVGDCGFAGRQHVRMAKAACYGETETWETSDELVSEYLAYDGGQDMGVSLAAVLLAWYKAGKILGFAPVDHTDPAAVDSAMQAFKGIYAGVDLTDDADELFGNAEPWTTANGETPDPDEGHCIAKVYADGNSVSSDPVDGWVTWGAFQESTQEWTAACLTEAFVIITSEDEAAKVDMPALLADIEALGGTEGATATERKGRVMSIITKVEQEAEKIWREVDGEARSELKQAVADAKTELAKFLPLVTQAKADVEAAVEAAEPAIKSAVEAVLEKLAADAGTLLAGGSPDTPAPAPEPAPAPVSE